MMIKNMVFLVSVIVLILVAAALNSLLPKTRTIIAAYTSGKSVDTMAFNFHEIETAGEKDEAYFRATLDHEMIHSFKAMGIIDQDVPTAAAMGYYREWHLNGLLRETDKQREFNLGVNSSSPEKDIMEIVSKYRSRKNDSETIESYSDGARLAGLISKIFEKDDQSVMIYVLSLSMGLDHKFALRILEDKGLSKVIFGFRTGEYFSINQEKLDKDLDEISKNSRMNAIRYINALSEAYQIGLVPHKDVEMTAIMK